MKVHGFQFSGPCLVDHFFQGGPGGGRKLRSPGTCDCCAFAGIGDVPGAGKPFGNGAHFYGALIIVFFGERGKATARFGELSCQQKCIEQVYTGAIAACTSQEILPDQYDDPAPLGDRRSNLKEVVAAAPSRCFDVGPC